MERSDVAMEMRVFNRIPAYSARLRCPGCGEPVLGTEIEQSQVQYVKTKRGTEMFIHNDCIGRVWNKQSLNKGVARACGG